MAMDFPQAFVEEVEFSELHFLEVVGRGAFGVVSRARWRNKDVAVKLIETESEKKAFRTELKQLSRVSHTNIVHLYGASTKMPVCLVMEYAEGGSLYNVLHCEPPQPEYTPAHAMSWALQCACGVVYLHAMKPKALIHRDLKPPNLLLVAGGTILKICDFGTACDVHTHMTNNKGSAAWMAPEVFEGSNYSEKCDVFSWGIILWEVITRRKPFDDIGGPAFRIMWAVHMGKRPPMVQNCPKSIETLMTRCWSSNPAERPCMSEVMRIMQLISQFFTGANEPLVYPNAQKNALTEGGISSVYDTPPGSSQSGGTTESCEPTPPCFADTIRHAFPIGEPVPVAPTTPKAKPVVVEEMARRTSAPASLAASHENLVSEGGKGSRSSTPNVDLNKRFSADLSKLEELDYLQQAGATPISTNQNPVKKTHRRSGSFGTAFVGPAHGSPLPVKKTHRRSGSYGTAFIPPVDEAMTAARTHRRTGSYGNTPAGVTGPEVTEVKDVVPSNDTGISDTVGLGHSITAPGALDMTATSMSNLPLRPPPPITTATRSVSWQPSIPTTVPLTEHVSQILSSQDAVVLNAALHAMEQELKPLPPCLASPESMAIYEQHVKLSNEYFKVQAEISLLTQRKHDLAKESEQEEADSHQLIDEFKRLVAENESLTVWHKDLQQKVQALRSSARDV